MSWYALDGLDDAVGATRRFLFPFSFRRWFRLAVITFFLGWPSSGGVNIQSPISNIPGYQPSQPTAPTGTVPSIPLTNTLILVAGIIVAIVLLFAIISFVMRFVLVDVIRTDEVRVWRPFVRRFGRGIRLFFFELIFLAILLSPIIVYGILVFEGRIGIDYIVHLNIPVLAAIGVVYALAALLFGIFMSLTKQLVVPVMIREDVGVLAAWRRFWPTLRRNGWQFFVYLLAHWVLTLVVSIGALFVGGLLAAIVILLGLLVGVGVASVFGGPTAALASPAGIAAYVVVVVLFVLLLLAVLFPIRIVARTFVTTYELAVLGYANPRFDLLPDGGDDVGDGVGSTGDDGDDGDGGDRREDRNGSRGGNSGIGGSDERGSSGNDFVWPHDADDETDNGVDDRST